MHALIRWLYSITVLYYINSPCHDKARYINNICKASSDTHNWSLAFIEGEGLHHVHSPLFDLAYILLCYNR